RNRSVRSKRSAASSNGTKPNAVKRSVAKLRNAKPKKRKLRSVRLTNAKPSEKHPKRRLPQGPRPRRFPCPKSSKKHHRRRASRVHSVRDSLPPSRRRHFRLR